VEEKNKEGNIIIEDVKEKKQSPRKYYLRRIAVTAKKTLLNVFLQQMEILK